jgi:hypothetical protein
MKPSVNPLFESPINLIWRAGIDLEVPNGMGFDLTTQFRAA